MDHSDAMREGIAILEVSGLGASLVILDQVEKAARVRLWQAELNDFYGFVLKITGDASALQTAVAVARQTAEMLQVSCVTTVIEAPDDRARVGIASAVEYNPLIEQNVVYVPAEHVSAGTPLQRESGIAPMNSPAPFAIGLIETQGFTAVFEAIDTAVKTANVEVLAREKLGGGYITVVIKGDVAAVRAAIDAGSAKVAGLGKLIAAHVIASPSQAVLSLLPVK